MSDVQDVQDHDTVPAIRFKRRKVAHVKRVHAEEDAPTISESPTPDDAPVDTQEEGDSATNLREILRARKRPRDRPKDVARKAEAPETELVPVEEAPRQGLFTSRFVAQTGQVVDRDDKQM
jgi:hypothetical protein